MSEPWNAHRIREDMRDNGYDWFPPSAEQANEIADRTFVGATTDWWMIDPATHDLRNVTESELFDFSEKIKASEQIRDGLDDDEAMDWTAEPEQRMRMATSAEIAAQNRQLSEPSPWLKPAPEQAQEAQRTETTVAPLTAPDPTVKTVWGQTSARSTWETRMAQNQPGAKAADRAASMARHPSGRQVPPPMYAPARAALGRLHQ